jgi:hypothetical protein
MRNFIWDGDLVDQWKDNYQSEVSKHSLAKNDWKILESHGILTETIDGHHISPVCVKFILAFKKQLDLCNKFNINWQTLLQSNAHDIQSLYVLYLVATGKLNKVGKDSYFYNKNPEPESEIIIGKIKPSLISDGSREYDMEILFRLVGAYRIKAGHMNEAYEAYMNCLFSKKPGEHVWPDDYCQDKNFAIPFEEMSKYSINRDDFISSLQKLKGLIFISSNYNFWMGKHEWNDGLGKLKHCGKLTPNGPLAWFFDDNKTSCTTDDSQSSDPLPHNWGYEGPNPFMIFIEKCRKVLIK